MGALHIGAREDLRGVDRAIDMAFGGEMHHRVEIVFFEQCLHRPGIANVAMNEFASSIVAKIRHAVEISGIGQRIEYDDAILRVANRRQ